MFGSCNKASIKQLDCTHEKLIKNSAFGLISSPISVTTFVKSS